MKCYFCPKEGNNKFFDYPLCDSCLAMAKGHIERCLDGVRREKERSEPHAKSKEIPPKGV